MRCSRKTAATEPFTLSRKTKEGIICHQRIAYSPSSATFSIVIKYKSKEKKDKLLQGKPHGSLDDFIRLIKPKLHLDKACKGSDFQSLFVSTQVLEEVCRNDWCVNTIKKEVLYYQLFIFFWKHDFGKVWLK